MSYARTRDSSHNLKSEYKREIYMERAVLLVSTSQVNSIWKKFVRKVQTKCSIKIHFLGRKYRPGVCFSSKYFFGFRKILLKTLFVKSNRNRQEAYKYKQENLSSCEILGEQFSSNGRLLPSSSDNKAKALSSRRHGVLKCSEKYSAADLTFNILGRIDVLIGAEVFLDLCRWDAMVCVWSLAKNQQ